MAIHDHRPNGSHPPIVSQEERTFPSWVNATNIRFIVASLIGSGVLSAALYLFPASQGQLTEFKKEVGVKLEEHDRDIAEIKDGIKDLRSTATTILFNLTNPKDQDRAPVSSRRRELPAKPATAAKPPRKGSHKPPPKKWWQS